MLLLIRGLPGSGKSTLARTSYSNFVHYEADHYLTSCDGTYYWHPEVHTVATRLCRMHVDLALSKMIPVVVTGTFLTKAKVDSYKQLAHKHGHTFKCISCIKDYGSVHQVPEFSLRSMREAWEDIENYEEEPPVS